jgi:hypothetical protein
MENEKNNRSNKSIESEADRQQALIERQDKLANQLAVKPESLRGLVFCDVCKGSGQITKTDMAKIALNGVLPDIGESFTSKTCQDCDGTGFMFGSNVLKAHEWIYISRKLTEDYGYSSLDLAAQSNQPSAYEEEIIEKQIKALRCNQPAILKPKRHRHKRPHKKS